MNNWKKLSLVIFLLIMGASLIATNAQTDAKKSAKEKLGKIEGDVSSIIIKTDDGEVEFTGEEAEHLFKKMKANKIWVSASPGEEIIEIKHDDIDHEGDMIFIKKKHKGDFNWTGAMELLDDDGTSKKIDVHIEDGEKKVTVTSTKDGEESVETYEGEEADKFIEDMKKEHGMMFHGDDVIHIDAHADVLKEGDDVFTIKKIKDKDGKVTVHVTTGGDDENVFIHEGGDHDLHWVTEDIDGDMKKEVEVEVKDGVKTVTVTTTEDGEEKVQVYTGDEADEYLAKMRKENKELKKMKKIMIEIEEEEHDEDEEKEEE